MPHESESPRHPMARMSPGPWWGFNGVNTLELRNGLLVHSFYVIFHGYVSRNYELRTVTIESRGVRERRRKRWTSLVLTTGGTRRAFIGRPDDAEPFIDALAEALSA